jgi:glycosyltransferase involved in cell wall biosynthesis
MPLLSVLTPALAARATLLAQTGESVATQRLPSGWDVEWIVEEDGTEPALAQVTTTFPFARHRALGARLGVAAARNLALSRAHGELVHVLDSDDLLLPDGLAVVIAAFQRHPEIQWVVGQADNLMPDGSRVAFDPISPTGYIEAGAVTRYVREHGRTPFHPAGLTLRTTIARALGGWAALPRAEDVALLVAVADLAPGWHTPDRTWLYRQHVGQMTRAADWPDLDPACWDVVHQRLAALDRLDITMGV